MVNNFMERALIQIMFLRITEKYKRRKKEQEKRGRGV